MSLDNSTNLNQLPLISIYANLDKKPNLIGPYIVVGCFLHSEYQSNVESILNSNLNKSPLQIIQKINKLKLPGHKFYTYPFILDSYFIDLYGLDISITKAARYVESTFKFKILNEELDTKDPFFIFQSSRLLSIEGLNSTYIPNSIQETSLSVAQIYSQAFRDYYLGFYFRKYPNLWINTHKGRTTPHHFKMLKQCSLLPECYIKHLTAQFFIDSLNKTKSKSKSINLPFWLENWIEQYSF